MPPARELAALRALAHALGEDRCFIYSQDISEKSSEMLRLNLILSNLVGSLPNIIQGNTLTEPVHKKSGGRLKTFDFVVSNPPFKLGFPEYSDSLSADTLRFWAGMPNKVKTYKDIQEKNNSRSAGQYFDIKIEYVDIIQDKWRNHVSHRKMDFGLGLRRTKFLHTG